MGFLDFFTGSKENDDFYKTTPGDYKKSFEGENNSIVKKTNAPKKNLTRANRVALMGGPQPAQASKGSNSLSNISNFKGGKRTRKQRKTRKH
jgi:hypothetical protein